jgi:hypothetical protein
MGIITLMNCSTVLTSSKGDCRSAEVCPIIRRAYHVTFISYIVNKLRKRSPLVDESLERHVGIKVATHDWSGAMFQTNAGLLCSVGSGSSVALAYSVGLRPPACWDSGFESRRGHRCLSFVGVVRCRVEVSASG